MAKKNAAVIGYGGMGAGFHVKNLRTSDVCNLAGIYDIDEAKREKARADGVKVYETREELLSDPTIDMVTIATPNDVHEEIAIDALNHGKNVISEKPVTLSLESLERMIAAAKKNGKIFSVHQNRRFDVDALAMKQIHDSGEIGSATEFWRRWHMSLGNFFRDYVYIPLGGNRHDQPRNILIVWFLTGMWHGASWNFILWGLYYGFLLMWEKKHYLRALERMPKPISFAVSHIYTTFITVFGFAIFYFDKNLLKNLGYLFGIGCASVNDIFTKAILMDNVILLAAAVLFSIPIMPKIRNFLAEKLKMSYSVERVFKTVTALCFIAVSSVRLVGNTYSAFLYYRF